MKLFDEFGREIRPDNDFRFREKTEIYGPDGKVSVPSSLGAFMRWWGKLVLDHAPKIKSPVIFPFEQSSADEENESNKNDRPRPRNP